MDINWIQVVLDSFISTSILISLIGWLGRLWAKRILQNESAGHNRDLEAMKADFTMALETYKSGLETSKQYLQAKIDKTVLVTRVHFETEFAALKEVFERLAEVRLQFAGLRPMMSVVPREDTKDAKRERLARRVEPFRDAYDRLLSSHENLKPFYPEDVYLQIEKCRTVADREITELRISGDELFTSEWFAEGKKNLNEFLAAYNIVTDLIRERISKLAVIPPTLRLTPSYSARKLN